MLGKKLIKAAAGAAGGEETDEYFQNTTLLLHGDGTQGNQNNTFLDSSTNNFTITRNGNTTQGSFSPFSKPDGRWGNSFNTSTTYLTTAADSNIQAGTGNITVEAWVYVNALPSVYASILSVGGLTTGNWQLELLSTGKIRWETYSTVYLDQTNFPLNVWFHVAVVRTGTGTDELKLYLNGVNVESATCSESLSPSSYNLTVGASNYNLGNNRYLDGYISNLRYKKSAVYTSGFTPSTTPLTSDANTVLLTCQSNRFVDNGNYNYSLTATGTPKVTPFSPFPVTTEYSPSVGGSAYFDGSGDYLVTASNVSAIGTGDFTFETWVYPTSISDFKYLFSIDGDNNFSLVLNNNSYTPYFYAGSLIILSSKDLIGNQWNHIALVRNGSASNNLVLYVNGESGGSATFTANVTAGLATISARAAGTPYFLQGYQSGLRLTSNAVYTSAFTPPSSPPTAISGTELLLNFTNAGIYDSTGFNVLETVGNAQIDTTTVKYGTGAMKFDGSGDYCVGPNQPWINFGSGDLTIECWVRFNSVASTQMFVSSNYNASTGAGGWTFGYRADNTTLIFSVNANVQYGKTWSPSIDTWYFVTVCREGTSLRFFVDGTQIGTTSTSSDNISGATTLMVGSNLTTPQYLNGYIDDLRITKGVARYTSNFTVPSKALPNIGV